MRSLFCFLSVALTTSLWRAHPCSPFRSGTPSLSLPLFRAFSLPSSHPLSRYFSLSLSVARTLTLFYTLTHTLSLSHTRKLSFFLFYPPTLSLTHTHKLSFFLSYTPTLSHTHTYTKSLCFSMTHSPFAGTIRGGRSSRSS